MFGSATNKQRSGLYALRSEENVRVSSFPDIFGTEQGTYKPCINCGKPGNFRCGACKTAT